MSSSGDIPIEIIAGFLVLMLGIVSFSIQMAIKRSKKQNSPAQDQVQREKATDTQRQKNALAEALRRNPELATSNDPEMLRQLKTATSDIVEEMRTAELLSQVNQEKATAQRNQLLQEQRLDNEQKAKKHAQQVAEKNRLAREALIEKTADYSFIKRTIARHKLETAGGVGLVLAAILILALITIVPPIQQQLAQAAEQAETEQAETEAANLRAERIATCDTRPEMGDLNSLDDETIFLYCGMADRPLNARSTIADNISDPNVLNVLATDPDASVREKVAENPNTGLEGLALLSKDQEVLVRKAVARSPAAGLATFAILASDQEPDIRMRVVTRTDLSTEVLDLFATDPNPNIRSVVAQSRQTSPETLSKLAQDPLLANQVAKNPSASPETLAKLAKIKSLKRSVAANPSTSFKVLSTLKRDKDRLVSSAAKKNMQNR